MNVKNSMRPVHPGEILSDELVALGLSDNELSDHLDIPVKQIKKLLNRQCNVTADIALRLARYFGTTPQVWLNLQKTYELRQAEIESGCLITKRVRPRQTIANSERIIERKAAWKAMSKTDESAKFMKRLDKEYRKKTKISERRFYSIFFSQVNPSPIMILGSNPGGDPKNWDESELASTSFYENGEHEYVDCCYPIACVMSEFLKKVLDIEKECIREIPKTNLIFRRSVSIKQLPLKVSDAISEAKPILEQILRRVEPDVIICEGFLTLRNFEKHYCTVHCEKIDGESVDVSNGNHAARIYRADHAFLLSTGKYVKLLGLGHPSRFGGRSEWNEVIQLSRNFLAEYR